MSYQKPLPPIPTPTTLSIVARNHRARLIRHLLSETQESNVESWKCAIEDALDELGTSIGAGNWLNGNLRGKRISAGMRNSYGDFEKDSKKSDPNDSERYSGLPEQRQAEETTDSHVQVLKELKVLAVRSPLPTASSSHLLLCLTPLDVSGTESSRETGNPGCVFHSGTFTWPTVDSNNPGNVVLYGLREWRGSENIQLVGGTFTLNGVKSLLQHYQLRRILRIAVYIHLSLILEQYFLVDSGVLLNYPRPNLKSPPTPTPNRPRLTHHESVDAKPTRRASLLPSGILSFFSRKGFGYRSQTISPVMERGASLDLTIPSPNIPPDTPEEASGRHRRFSFMGDKLERRISLRSNSHSSDNAEPLFASILRRLEASRELLSTSPGVSFAIPSLLIELADTEKERLNRKLTGDEKVALASLIGWDGKDSRGNGMSGMLGFVRQQGLSVLRSKFVPAQLSVPEKPSSTNPLPSPPPPNPPKPSLKMCGRPQLLTFQYYSHEESQDQSLGETILDLCATADLACEQLECKFKRGEHEIRLIHGRLRIVVLSTSSQKPIPDTDIKTTIELWESCIVCDCKSLKRNLSDGAFMLSFGKFLEILIYSPLICSLSTPICEHTTPLPGSSQELSPSRLNIKRHFRTSKASISLTLSVIEDIFELQVPRLQITRGSDKSARTSAGSTPPVDHPKPNEVVGSEDKKVLRQEIKRWWEGVADYVDKLEYALSDDDLRAFHKALPRLPSVDDAYEDIAQTPTQSSIFPAPRLPPNTPTTPTATNGSEIFAPPSPNSASIASSIHTPLRDNSALLLANLRHTLHRTEHSLYLQLAQTPVSSLNDVRRAFLSAAKGAHKRLNAWQEKHLSSRARYIGKLSAEEPEWFSHSCHVVPGSNVIVREDDWGSIIAFALSTADYNRELATLSITRSSFNTSDGSPPLSPPLSGSSFFSAAAGYRLFSSADNKQLDPDKEGAVWHVPEPYSAVISRKEHIRDPTSLLSIREVLRQKLPTDGTSGTAMSRSATLLNPAHLAATVPVSAWAAPDVSLNLQAAGGEVSGLPGTGSVEKLLQGFDSAASDISHPESVASEASSSAIFDAHIRRGKASSVISVESDQTIGKDNSSRVSLTLPPVPPRKDERVSPKPPSEESTSVSEGHVLLSPSFASTFASGLGTAMRYVMHGYESPRAHSPAFKSQHGLLLADAASIDARPHIKYDWTIGKRLKFSCTIYYAKQFDMLRRRCGIEDVFLKSLSRSMNWAAEGGKSKSNFWKTSDDRFIIKTLVNAWNVADLQVLVELAPSYFRYMESTTSKATVLAKLIGFYTIEIRNLESGTVQSKADLLIMENLFYGRTINKTFDLKGIQGRKVKAGANSANPTQNSKTLFDGEWIEGQQQTLMLVRPHSKNVLHEAIKSDAEFLSRSNIMDYSLLLGVDDGRKQIACGLVDTIGSYTFAKTLEYKAKHGLQSGKEITVMPPAEYQDRFVKALEGYFLACPDKWSKPADPSKIISDPNLLPSVF